MKKLTLAGTILFLLIGMMCFAGCTVTVGSPYVAEPTPTPTPAPTPTPVQVSTPSTIMFTVLKANSASPNAPNQLDRYYSVLTTDGDILLFSDFYRWDEMIPEQTYICTIANTVTGFGQAVYSVTNCNLYRYSYHAQVLQPTTFYDDYYYDGIWYSHDYTHYYNRNTGQYNDFDDWSDSTYQYYHYHNEYWKCDNEHCRLIGLLQIPAYVTVYQSRPPHDMENYY